MALSKLTTFPSLISPVQRQLCATTVSVTVSLTRLLNLTPVTSKRSELNVINGHRNYCKQPSIDTRKALIPQRLTKENVHHFMGTFDTILSDCDGVFWTCDLMNFFDGVADTIQLLRKIGNKIIFVSNNSLLDRQSYIDKFNNHSGFTADHKDMYVVTYATAVYLKEMLKVKTCYMMGTQGLLNEMESMGIQTIGFGADPDIPSYDPKELMKMKIDPNVDAVVVGYDEHFHHNKMMKAASYLRNPNCHFVATNDKEMRVSLGDHHVQPVTGSFVAAIAATSGRQPQVVGKPHRHMMDCILKHHPNIDLQRTIMIGDSLLTDVGFAKAVGIPSLLVLSGSASLKDVFDLEDKKMYHLLPEYYTDNICDFLELLENIW